MSIKARAEITLSCVIDVKATYRYYLLQSSTLSAPQKPTQFPPGGSWNDTEPTYTNGSTNSLYVVDCTIFSDDTFAYSKVSLSSSYEAAKEAYNKAMAAQNQASEAIGKVTSLETDFTVVQGQITGKVWQTDITEATSPLANRLTTVEDQYSQIDQTVEGISLSVGNLQSSFENLEVGGRNLLFNTDFKAPLDSNQYGTRATSYNLSIESNGYNGSNCLKAEANKIGNIGSDIIMTLSIYVELNTEYIFSGYVRADSDTNLHVRFGYGNGKTQVLVGTEWVYFKTIVKSGTEQSYNKLLPYIDTETSIYFSYLKLEKGNKATDWTPAPEDVDGSLAKVTAELALKIDKDDNDKIVSMLNAAADVINLEGQRITIDSPKFKLAADGTIEATDGKFSGEIVAKSLQVVSDWWVLAASEAGVSITVPSENDIGLVLGATSTLSGYRSVKLQGGSASLSVGTGGSSINSGFSVEGDLTADKMTASGVIESQRGVVSANNYGFYGKNTAGTNVKLLSVTGSDNVVLGDQDLPLYLWGGRISAPALIQSGTTGTVSVAAQSYTDTTITFPQAFPGTPCVVATLGNTASESQNMGKVNPIIFQRSATRAVIRIFNTAAGLVNVLVHWQATYQA